MEDVKKCEGVIWKAVRDEAAEISETETVMSPLLQEVVLSRNNLFDCVAMRLARKLGRNTVSCSDLFSVFAEAFGADEKIREAIVADIAAVKSRDPACPSFLHAILYFKGFQSVETYRAAHWLYLSGRRPLAYYLQSLSSEVFAVDIHPAAKIGRGIFLDHATAFVAGETSVVEDNVSILHEVTLGGTGNETGDRHPKVMSDVLIGAGAKLIGNITIGKGAKIGAGSVVLGDVEPHTTVAGVPARKINFTQDRCPATGMNQRIDC